jgi:hypothetical protein
MKLNPSIIALKDFENIRVFRLKLARYSTANKAPSLNASEQPEKPLRRFVYHPTFGSFTTYITIIIVMNDACTINAS